MHRLATTPGGWNPQQDGVIFVEQTPAPLVVLTAADTDIQLMAQALDRLPEDFPALRVTNLLHLHQQLTIDTYTETVLESAQGIVLRLLGGRSYWSYGLEVVREVVERTGATMIVLPGDDRPDPDLISHSTVPLGNVDRLWRYFTEGGVENMTHALEFLADLALGKDYNPPLPQRVPQVGRVGKAEGRGQRAEGGGSLDVPRVGVLFYRAHYLAGNMAAIEALGEALAKRNLEPVPVYVQSPREAEAQTEMLQWFQPGDGPPIQVLLNTTSFSLNRLEETEPGVDFWQKLDVPVLQVIFSGGTIEQWQSQFQGLSPRDIAMNVALPEVDGRIISRAVSFKAVQQYDDRLETDVVGYQPVPDRIEFVAELAANWVRLRGTSVSDRRVALILANYPTRDGRLANGVGLDTPASCVEILKALQEAGYSIPTVPETGDELIHWLTRSVTNDPEGRELRPVNQGISGKDYGEYFKTLPDGVQRGVCDRWGDGIREDIPVPGVQLGNVFVGIQPARGYDRDPALNYHAPDLEPPQEYLAFYYWVRQCFGAQAIVHVGKHGNLEWLPGKSLALSQDCYPEVAIGPLPHLYPFIVNDPGEGSQAKRRAQAVILDHLTPPLTRAELYGPLQELENLIDEYYEAQSLDPGRLSVICDRITNLVIRENLHRDLQKQPLTPMQETWKLDETFVTLADGYLCELKEAQIRDGLHIFGKCPAGRQLRDLIVAIARQPGRDRMGLTRTLAQAWNLNLDPLTTDPAQPVNVTLPDGSQCRTVGDVVEAIEQQAATLVEQILSGSPVPVLPPPLSTELHWIAHSLLPNLSQTDRELLNLLKGLDGRYIPAGPAGAPTRGRPEVLPTGRNFYSVDIRAVPTESAWDVGRKAAEALIERYTQEHGEYPRTIGLSVWGTSTMRTGGDDIAEALALLGVQPVWDGPSRRVIDFEILPLPVLGRPRVDVTLRISGFFRDAFPALIDLFDQAVEAVAGLEEAPDQNPLADRIRQETTLWQAQGLSAEQASQRSRHRIFGSKPGAYGAGLQGLIEAQNWTDDADLARAYLNWSSYAYGRGGMGRSAPEAFEQRLREVQVVLHNQDNREHDLLDSDDYYQFQGGMTVAARSLQGNNPAVYFGDHSLPENPRVRRLQEEVARVYRSRVVNPKWIAGVMRHGYKGAFEMAATLDYLFAYDATAHCVEDHMYQGVAEAYVLDPTVQQFVQQHNPWALRDMAERLLEAHQRGLWQTVPADRLDALRAIVHDAEGTIEGRNTPP
ncbi:MAG: cobaltochelatase subunit CobN [Leptolyngbyaceae cyanobacterium bins.59]|nr:cobaltochelatase subunit CobN [Leptolyngbyaceae cyanobacterium bins.59]